MIRRWLLPVLTVAMGMQLLRVFIPSLAWYLRDTVGLSSLSLAPYAFVTFSVGFLAAPLRQVLGSRAALRLTVFGVALARTAEQLSTDPGVDLWLSIAGTAAFLLFLPIYLGYLRAHGEGAAARWGFGFPLGLAFDIGLHGAAGTLDLSWLGGLLPTLIVVGMASLIGWSAWRAEPAEADTETSWSAALPLVGIGPLLVLQLLVFQSTGWVEEVAGLPQPWGFAAVMVGNLALVGGVRQGLRKASQRTSLLALGATVYLTLAAAYAATPGLLFLITLVLSQLVLGWGWGVITRRTVAADAPGLGHTGLSLPLGMLTFLALAFVYYVALDVALPFPRTWVLPLSALLFGMAAFWAGSATGPTTDDERRVKYHGTTNATTGNALPTQSMSDFPLRASAALLLVPWIAWVLRGPPPEPVRGGEPIRIMTYNIHSGFGAAGRHDPEAIAQVIEASGADIVALQEVSRVRLLDGGTDLSVWLSRRLRMPIVFRGTEEPIWGNAILSRYPMLRSGSADLPREGALIGRGYLWAEIDVGFPLLVINAHLHHVETDNHIRLVEVPALLDFWNQRPETILLGDLNAEPHYPEMALPAQAGLTDAWSVAGASDGFTWSAAAPTKRIDWIWHSADLRVTRIEVIDTLASDHLPVIAEIRRLP